MMKARRATALAKGIFAASLAAVGAAALSPDWLATLKAQGYYGNVDLGVTITPSQTPRAGEAVDFLVTVTNNGPDAANGVRATASADNLHIVQTDGCAGDPIGHPQCALPSPLAAGGTADYLLRMRVPTTSREGLHLSVSVASDDDEIAPGNETAVVKGPIEAAVDLRTESRCYAPMFPSPTASVVCDFDLHNEGPSAAIRPTVRFDAAAAGNASWRCEASRAGLCAAPASGPLYAFTPPVVEPGDVLRIRVELFPPAAPGAVLPNVGGGVSSSEFEIFPADNLVRAYFDTTLLRDGFEPRNDTQRP